MSTASPPRELARQSVFNGSPPDVKIIDDQQQEIQAVGKWVASRLRAGYVPPEIGVFVKSEAQIDRVQKAVAPASEFLADISQSMAGYSDATQRLVGGK